jgi:CHAD domain-containing protein
MDKYEISTSLTDDLSEKKIIQDTLGKIKDLEQSILNKFSKQDNSDLNAVFEIMEEDEELQINNLEKEKSKIDKILVEINEVKKSKSLAQIVAQHKSIVKEIK